MSTLTLGVELVSIECGACGGIYALTERYRQQCSEEGKSWTCPYCKIGWGFESRGENQKLRDQLARERAHHDQVRAALATAVRARAIAAGKLRRVHKGVCPECNRSFANLARHMKCKHSVTAGKKRAAR